MNRRNIRARGTPPNIPTDGQTTEHFFPDVIMHYFREIATYYFLSASTLYMHPHVSGTERVGFSKQDAHRNLVVKTPISMSGHETRSTAIHKLGKTRISVSGYETRSNH